MKAEKPLLPSRRAIPGLPVLPPHAPGMRIGLFGGSFNPPHEGHLLVSQIALRRLGLDALWWVVTPGNPLKDTRHLPPLAERIALARRMTDHPRIAITGFEAEIGTRYTYDTIAHVRRRCPGVKFVWIMGADNLRGFHRWQRWRNIARLVPIAVIDRPGSTLKSNASRAAQYFRQRRLDESDARLLVASPPPAWIFLHGRRSGLSSSAIRKGDALS